MLEHHSNTSEDQHKYLLQNQLELIIGELVERLANVITPKIADIITKQLNTLKLLPPIFPQTAMMSLPDEQYNIMNIITTNLGPIRSGKYPFFFITGSAGTGKTYTAVAMAVRALKNREIRRIILTRPAVEAGENLGFLPAT